MARQQKLGKGCLATEGQFYQSLCDNLKCSEG